MSRPVVIVLAGGASKRFSPLHDKPLFEFGAQSLLERHLRLLKAEGCERFVVVVQGSSAASAAAILDAVAVAGRLAVQPEANGMADAVLSARPALEAFGDGPVYVTQAQDVVDPKLHQQMLGAWTARPAKLGGLIAAARVDGHFPGGYLTLKGQRVTGVVEKPGPGKEPSDLVNLVAHVFESWRELVETVEGEAAATETDDAYERALTRMMAKRELQAVVYEGRWQALKFPWQVLDVMDMTASVKLTAHWGIDHMHLLKKKGRWKIVQILWQSHPPTR